jgi:hypothetical protein
MAPAKQAAFAARKGATPAKVDAQAISPPRRRTVMTSQRLGRAGRLLDETTRGTVPAEPKHGLGALALTPTQPQSPPSPF